MGWQSNVRILDLKTGNALREFSHLPAGNASAFLFPAIAFSSDGNYVATANLDESISVFELKSGTEVANLVDEDIIEIRLGLEPPSQSTTGFDRSKPRRKGLGQVRAFAFSSDGHYVVTANRFGTEGTRREGKVILTDDETLVARYVLRPEDLIAEACSRLKRNLTPKEWSQYLGDEPYHKTCPNLP